MDEHVLVTGGTGFLGQALVRALRARHTQVRVLVRPHHCARPGSPAHTLATLGAELVTGDVLNAASLPPALANISTVLHLAGRLLVAGVAEETYARLHIDGTRNLLDACAHTPTLRRIVHVSTTGVLGPTGSTPAAEDAPLRPATIYERTKAAGERLARDYAAQHALPLCVVRPALVYGPGDLHLLGWFRAIQRGYYRVVGTGDSLLHPIYIDDLVDGLLRAMQRPAHGQVYHLIGERAVPIRELAAAIAAALGKRLPRGHMPLPLARAAAWLLEALPLPPERLPLTRSRLAFMTESRAYSGEHTRRNLGFVPHTDLTNGLQRTVAWYHREGLL